MNNGLGFWQPEELKLAEAFLVDGYLVRPAESREDLDRIRDLVASVAASYLKLPVPENKGEFLDRIHERVGVERLNDLRLTVIREMNEEPWLRPSYFKLARRAIEVLVGNELVMQRRVNLSIQLPSDDSSLLPIHADVWAGDSPYEIVLWAPYVDVRASKTMFILPREQDARYQARMAQQNIRSSDGLFRLVEADLRWPKMAYGEVMLFTQNLMHGNVVNRERETRWSSNCRFKSLFSPYHDKKLGEFFEPILIRPATQIGAAYRLPSVNRAP